MTESAWVSLVALAAMLILAISGLRASRLGARRIVTMALMWGSIFAAAVLFFSVIGT